MTYDKEYARNYYQKNRERILKQSREHYQKNKTRIREQRHKHYQKNPRTEYQKNYYHTHKQPVGFYRKQDIKNYINKLLYDTPEGLTYQHIYQKTIPYEATVKVSQQRLTNYLARDPELYKGSDGLWHHTTHKQPKEDGGEGV